MPGHIQIRRFDPDLVVEVTMVCDLKCNGCYAPTVFPRLGAEPDAFLSPERLGDAIAGVRQSVEDPPIPQIAVRGGEPALHPNLKGILGVLRPLALNLYLETNGNWILTQDKSLLGICASLKVIVKISFDSMHVITASDLARMCGFLDRHGVQWMVAITEASESEFQATRDKCKWIPDEKIFFQPKAFHQDSLIRPRLGVIHPNGHLSSGLSAKAGFLVHSLDTPSEPQGPNFKNARIERPYEQDWPG